MSEASYDVLLDPYHCITDEPVAPEEAVGCRPSQRKMRQKLQKLQVFKELKRAELSDI